MARTSFVMIVTKDWISMFLGANCVLSTLISLLKLHTSCLTIPTRVACAGELERRYKIRVAAEKEMAFQSSKAVGDADAVASPGDARK